jgi:hypothetical protein
VWRRGALDCGAAVNLLTALLLFQLRSCTVDRMPVVLVSSSFESMPALVVPGSLDPMPVTLVGFCGEPTEPTFRSLACADLPLDSDCGQLASLWQHVYRPKRLVVLAECKEVTGTIRAKRVEPDGDVHIQLKLDDGLQALLNQKNRTRQHGCLVVEPVCIHPVTQTDAKEACRSFVSPVTVPKVGARVRVVGSYVLDNEGGHGWREIHPVSVLEEIKP